MALATLSIDLQAKLASFEGDLKRATGIAEQQAGRMAQAFGVAKAAAAGLAGALSVEALRTFFTNTVTGIDALNDLADATGSTVEKLSALEDVAARTGTPMATVGDAVIKLNKALGEASKPGSDAAAALQLIGLSAAELKRLDPAEALRQTAVALAGFANDGNKARLVQELFGKSLREVAPLLNDLAKAGELNAKVTSEQAAEAEKFNQQLAALSKNSVDTARALVSEVLPALNSFLRELANARTAYGSVFAGVRDNFRFSTGTITGDLQQAAEKIAEIQRTIANADAGKTKPLFTDQRKALLEELDLLERRRTFLRLQQQEQVPQASYSNEGRTAVRKLPDLPVKVPEGPKAKNFISNSFDQDTINALKALESVDATRLRTLESALTGLFELQRETRGDPAVGQAIAKVRQEIDELGKKKLPDAEPLKAYVDALAAINDTTATKIEETSKALDELFRLRENGIFGPEIDEAIKNLREKLATLKKPVDELSEFARQAASNIQDALGDTMLQVIEGNFNKLDRLWAATIKKLIAQAAAAQLGKYLLGTEFGKTGELGGAAGALVEVFKRLGTRAGGGPVMAGVPYLVGERGPEIVIPKAAGTVLPNGVLPAVQASAVQPVVNNFSVNVQGDASENTLRLINGALANFEARMARRG